MDEIERQIAAADQLATDASSLLSINGEIHLTKLPFGFAHDSMRSIIGHGEQAYSAAKRAFEAWSTFDLGWVRVANAQALIKPGQLVAVEAYTLGLWTLNLSRIVETVDSADRFGFIYATTRIHVEQGEERFVLTFDRNSGEVWYELDAISRPRRFLARLGYPVTRAFQHKFARDSHSRVRKEVLKAVAPL